MVVIWKYWYNSCINKIFADGYITTHHLRCYHVEKESMPGYVLKEQENLLLRIVDLNQRLSVHSVLLLISSERLIVELLNQKLSMCSVLLPISS